jgi:bacillithiol system protein YtxJ
MNWLVLNEINQLKDLIQLSYNQPVIVYKHSTRCSVSSFVKARLESDWPSDLHISVYYLDLLAYRPISNAIAEKFSVEHQSPQLLLIRDGHCIYDSSHSDIQIDRLLRHFDESKSQQ